MEFILEHRNMYWSVEPLKPPKATKVLVDSPPIENPSKPPDEPLTEWIAEPSSDSIPEAGIHYVVRTKALANNNDYIVYPESEILQVFRHQWIMCRSKRPFEPQPTNTPMPDREPHEEDRARLFSVYMRPWVLDRADASEVVPFIADLDRPLVPRIIGDVAMTPEPKRLKLLSKTCPTGPRSYTAAWSSYLRGRIVS